MIGSEYVMPDPDRDDALDRKDELDEAVDVFMEKPAKPFNPSFFYGVLALAIVCIGSIVLLYH